MIRNIYRRTVRQPLAALAVVLFAAVLTVALCHLNKTRREELRSYEETYASVPVFFKVVDLNGSKPRDYEGINGWVVDLFEADWFDALTPYVKETHQRVSLSGIYYVTDEVGDPILNRMGKQRTRKQTTTGIYSTLVAEELTEGWGGKIYWNEGYDEEIFKSNEFVCIVPKSMEGMEEVDLEFTYEYWPTGIKNDLGGPILMEVRRTFQVVGTYTDPGNSRIYCPYFAMEWIHANLRKAKVIEEIGATLSDNTRIEAFREVAARWFAKPNPIGEKTPWGRFGYEHYLYALNVDDALLTSLETNLKNSLRINQLATAVVFLLSVGTGFLTGFLVIRSRKREITLMRTTGTAHRAIFAQLALEQMVNVALGMLLGGSYCLWQPLGQLGVFACIYFGGLGTALAVFLRKNLLCAIREDE